MPDFLPRRNSAFAHWTRSLSQALVERPTVYRVTPEEAETYAQEVANYRSLLAATLSGGTNTRLASRAAADARVALERRTRQIVGCFRLVVTPGDLARIGLRPPSKNRRPTPAPTTAPLVTIERLSRQWTELSLRDPVAMFRRAKPKRVESALIFVWFGDDPPTDPKEWTMLTHTGRTRCSAAMPSDTGGNVRAWFAARWVAPSNKPGPLGPMASVIVPPEGMLSVA